MEVVIVETDMAGASDLFPGALPIVPTGYTVTGKPGEPSTADAAATLASISIAVGHVRCGSAAAVITNPIAKHVLYDVGFQHPGHTEYLGELAREKWGLPAMPVMMLWSEALAVVPVTIHVSLKSVPTLLTQDLIVETARIVDSELRSRFGLQRPRIACAGLNPHAGEGGSMGREEIETIVPALERLRADGIVIEGPLSADTMFHAAARQRYDVALVMYHDQGLIPIKTLSFDTGVNVTLGLPFIRTSPDHGTAFAIAGQGLADPSSFVAALDLAARLYTRAPPSLVEL
jgi:4-hydroxythreonine-4-phosphate dehydrogenase